MHRIRIYYYIFILTFADVIFTATGLNLGIVEEANPYMDYLIELSLPITLVGILVVTIAILYMLYKVENRVRWLPLALKGLLIIKVVVILLHFQWIAVASIKRVGP